MVVNLVELLCTAGLPAIYTAVLAQQELAPAAHYAYLGLYILGYIADDSADGRRGGGGAGQRQAQRARRARGSSCVSGAVMLALGAVLLLRPQWLV